MENILSSANSYFSLSLHGIVFNFLPLRELSHIFIFLDVPVGKVFAVRGLLPFSLYD